MHYRSQLQGVYILCCNIFLFSDSFNSILLLILFYSLKQSSSKDSLQRFGDLKGETRDGFDVVNGKIVSL